MPKRTAKRSKRMSLDPNDETIRQLVAWFHEHAAGILATVTAFTTAAARTYLDNGRITGRDVCEWFLCGVFVASSRPLWGQIGLGDEYGAFIGVIVGMVGARVLRVAVETLFSKWLGRLGGK